MMAKQRIPGKYTYIIFIFLIAALAILFIASGKYLVHEPAVEIQAENCYDITLNVAADCDYRPYVFYDKDGNLSGNDVELINCISNYLKVNVNMMPKSWGESLEAVKSGSADILLTCEAEYSEAYPDDMLLSIPVRSGEFVVFGKKSIASVNALYGKRIGIMRQGNVNSTIFSLGLKEFCTEYNSNMEALEALADDECDYVVMRYIIGEELLDELGSRGRGIKPFVSVAPSYISIGIAGNNTQLKSEIDEAIYSFMEDGTIDRLSDKWISEFDKPHTFVEMLADNVWLAVAVVMLLFAVVLLRYRSKENKIIAKASNEMVQAFINNYDAVYCGNLYDHTYKNLTRNETTVTLRDETETFENFIKSYFDELVHPDDRNIYDECLSSAEIIKKAFGVGQPKNFEYRRLKNGAYIWYRATVNRISENELLIGFKKCESEIAQQKLLLDYFVNSYTTAFFVNLKDETLNILHEDETHRKKVTLSGDRAKLNRFLDEHIHIADLEMVRRFTDAEYVADRLRKEDYLTFVMREVFDEEERIMRGLIIKCEDEYHIAVGFLDITKEMQKERELRAGLSDALAMAQQANSAKTFFLNNMSHDIRTPMNAIIGYNRLALSHIDDKERVREYLNKSEQASDHLLSLINDVLDMSRIESGKTNLDEEPQRLAFIVQALGDIFQADLGKKNHTFLLKADDIENDIVICDRLKLNQVLMNVISNSIKYTDPGGTISMSVTKPENSSTEYATYEFIISDNGIGMSKEFLETIFTPFTRAKSSTVSGIQGTGLGMAITKNIVDMMGGKIEILSSIGEGTTTKLTFDFKIAKSDEDKEKVSDAASMPLGTGRPWEELNKGRKILLVEDNEFNREIATEILEEYGYVVDTASDGDIAVDKVRAASKGDYDLILMDIQMPTMDGYEATRLIRSLDLPLSDIPIIAMTANAFDEDRRLALEAGMNEHIPKPIDVMLLKQIIEAHLNNGS